MKCFLVFSGGIKWEFLLIFIFIIDYQIKWDLINPFLPNVSFDSHESIRKPKVFWCFQWIQKKTMGRKRLRIGNIRNCDCFKWKCFSSNDYVRNVELVLMSRIEESEGVIRSTHQKFKSSRQEVFYYKGVLRNFAKFTGKRWCQRLFFNRTLFTEHL